MTNSDTDVVITTLGLKAELPVNLFILTGVGNKSRILNVQKMTSSLGSRVCNALIVLHTFTGCDSTSAFYGKGKRTAFSLLLGNESFIDAFGELGCSFLLSDNITKALARFVSCLYGQSNAQTVNDARYKLFCVASSSLPEKTIPPTTDALSQHCQRANYQAAIFKSSLTPKMNAPPPTDVCKYTGCLNVKN